MKKPPPRVKRKKKPVAAVMPPPPAPQPPQATVSIIVPSKNVPRDFVRNFFSGGSGNLRMAVCGLLAACAVIRWPWAVSWMGEPITSQILTFADLIKTTAWPVILLFMKQWNVSGGQKSAFQETTSK